MCGLVGIAGDTTLAWKDIFNELLVIDTVRGPHSTGAGFVSRNSEHFSLVKRSGHPWNLFSADEYQMAMSVEHPQKVLMGHNRWATIGDKTEQNAHPFMFDNILGAHNGTLDQFCIKNLVDHKLYDTDSQAIFATMNAKSADDALKEMSGAWALVWYDKRDHTLNMLRNDRRPLFYTYSQDRCTLVWASEAEMLQYVFKRRKKTMLKDDKGRDEIFSLPANMLYSWNIPVSSLAKIEVPAQRKLEGKTWVSSYVGPFRGVTKSDYIYKPSNDVIIPFDKRQKTKKFRHPYKDKYNRTIVRSEFEAMVTEGCMFCNANGQHFNEFIHIVGPYIGYHTPYMCEDCYNSSEQYEIAQYAI